jgi:cysteine desulfurase
MVGVGDLTHTPTVGEFEPEQEDNSVAKARVATALEAELTMTLISERSSRNRRPKSRTVYLDCNATTHTHPVALHAAQEAMDLCYGNPSSTHITGLHAKSFLESARAAAALAVGAGTDEEIIFNSGATEGIQTTVFSVLYHLAQMFRSQGSLSRFRILYGSTEHKAVPAALQHWVNILGVPAQVESVPVDSSGILDLAFIEQRLNETALLCTMAVNNETGIIQPLEPLARILSSTAGRDCLWFVDGVQALGKTELNLHRLGAHYACFSGHKINAPKGIGFLYVRAGSPYTPLIVGGGQERGMRSGTENLPGAAAFGRILQALNDPASNVFLTHDQLVQCQEKLIQTLQQCFPTLVWNTDLSCCVPTTLNFSVEGVSSKELMNAFDAAGVRVSGGSACSSGKASESHVLTAMHLHKWRAQNAIRLSFGPANSIEEIEEACAAIRAAGEALQANCMIPHRPARADQALELLNSAGSGISELRSSQGTRAWLFRPENEDVCFLIADCNLALVELKSKLACRGIVNSHILVLENSHPSDLPPTPWMSFPLSSGRALLFCPSNKANSPLILFCPSEISLPEVLGQSIVQEKIAAQKVLVCFGDASTPLEAYDVLCWPQTSHSAAATPPPEYTREELSIRLKNDRFLVLDVREPFEAATSHLDEILMEVLGNSKARKSHPSHSSLFDFNIVPLSRLPQFILDCLNHSSEERILCVCRSGQRSLQAATLLRRIVGREAFSLKGGLAALLAPPISLLPRKSTT